MMLLTILAAAVSMLSPKGPELYEATVKTSKGSFVIEVHREWSPYGADRFYELATSKYYDDSRFFRTVAGKWVQFGIAGKPAVSQAWRNRVIPDDEKTVVPNLPRFIGFSNTAAGTRSTQVYINLRDNSVQDKDPAFAPFGKITKGWDVVTSLYDGYGEGSGGGMRSGHQDAMFEGGNVYMDANFPKLDKIVRVTVKPLKK